MSVSQEYGDRNKRKWGDIADYSTAIQYYFMNLSQIMRQKKHSDRDMLNQRMEHMRVK